MYSPIECPESLPLPASLGGGQGRALLEPARTPPEPAGYPEGPSAVLRADLVCSGLPSCALSTPGVLQPKSVYIPTSYLSTRRRGIRGYSAHPEERYGR